MYHKVRENCGYMQSEGTVDIYKSVNLAKEFKLGKERREDIKRMRQWWNDRLEILIKSKNY